MDIVVNQEIGLVPEGAKPISCQCNFYHQLLSSLTEPTHAPPVADLLRRFHGLEGHWVVVSPIHWQATHNDAMIIRAGQTLVLSDAESRLWFDALSAFLASENTHVHYHDAHTWLLQCKDMPHIRAKPVHHVLHQSMMTELKGLDETHFWQRFMTEIQMFFSAHALNEARLGLNSINGLWIWGDGILHEKVDIPIYCDEPLFKLASLLSTQVNDVKTSTRFAKNGLILYSVLSKQDEQRLQTQLQNTATQWYWNNVAYLSKPKRWWSRLIERVY